MLWSEPSGFGKSFHFYSRGLELEMPLRYPISLGSEPLSHYIQFMEFVRVDRTASQPGEIINIYMPEKLTNPNTVGWTPEKLGTLAGVVENIGNDYYAGKINNVNDVVNSIGSEGTDALEKHGMMVVANVAARIMKSGASAESVFGHVTKTIPNPYLTQIFRGVDFRSFEFNFKLYPHSRAEAMEIYNIIKAFRKASLPEKGQDNNYFLKYPSEFEIQYKYVSSTLQDMDNLWLPKFKRCVLTAINTDFTPTGMFTVTRDGFPSVISLSLAFSEIEIVLKGDIDDGY